MKFSFLVIPLIPETVALKKIINVDIGSDWLEIVGFVLPGIIRDDILLSSKLIGKDEGIGYIYIYIELQV